MELLSLPYFFLYRLRRVPVHEKRITVSTLLTVTRIALIPVIVFFLSTMAWLKASIFFCVAAMTDILDGMVARFFCEETLLGACLDALADKLLIISCFCVLASMHMPLPGIPWWFVAAIIAKELIQIGGTFFLFCKKKHLMIVPTYVSKMTTLMQILFFVWLLLCYVIGFVPVNIYYSALVLVTCAMGVTLGQYFVIGYKVLWKEDAA
ncbi:MAG TPA: CDP-alcohol phosphatidyltransferase family protein [Candidatus Bathyarchaeia archaeon]|nr:CDP-alcohol phosphatidyltransferase family protein [Candidatus Bathyarchaeia archaeon]